MGKSNENSMLLSIIIPVYNSEKYLEDCLESVFCQNLKRFEIIIINDGSTDESENIIKKYIKHYKNIVYIKQDNKGQGYARNRGIDIAKGKYIYFFDSDDMLVNNSLSHAIKKICENNLDILYFNGKTFYDGPTEKTEFNYFKGEKYELSGTGEELYGKMVSENTFSVSSCIYIVKAEILFRYNIRFPEKYKHEDEVFGTKVILRSKKASHITNLVFLRRVRAGSTMTNMNISLKIKSLAHVLEELSNFYDEYNFNNHLAEKMYIKRMRGIYLSALTYINSSEQNYMDEDIIKVKNHLTNIYEKFNGFDMLARIGTDYFSLYKLLMKARNWAKKRSI